MPPGIRSTRKGKLVAKLDPPSLASAREATDLALAYLQQSNRNGEKENRAEVTRREVALDWLVPTRESRLLWSAARQFPFPILADYAPPRIAQWKYAEPFAR